MIESALLTRFFVDYFWEQKWLNVLHSAVFALVLLCVLLSRQGRVPRVSLSDGMVAILLAIVAQSYLRFPSESALVEAVKFVAFGTFYLLARLVRPSRRAFSLMGWFSLGCVCLLAAAALLRVGYQQWGDVFTFVGGYYFKTDVALAALIFLAIVSAEFRQVRAVVIASLAGVVIIWFSNSRIALPVVLAIPLLARQIIRGRSDRVFSLVVTVGVALSVGVGVASLVQLSSPHILGLDLKDPFSDENTQGRALLWLALLKAYQSAPMVEKVFGMGLIADQFATADFVIADVLAGARAHNSYIYVLMAFGVLGLLFMLSLGVMIVSLVFRLSRSLDFIDRKWAAFLAALILIFAIMSLTAEVVVRPQLMLPLFSVFGLAVSRACLLADRVQLMRGKKAEPKPVMGLAPFRSSNPERRQTRAG